MPGSSHPHSDVPLSDTLSARSYLELGHDAFQAQLQPQFRPAEYTPASISNPLKSGDLIQASSTSGPHLRPRQRRPIHKEAERTETAADTKDPHHEKDRPVRKRGRPRIETAKDAAAIEERRLQIRRAQRTYRQKKEATIQTLKTRVEQLEQTLQQVSDLLTAAPEELDALTSPSDLSRARQLALAEIKKAREFPAEVSDPVGRTTESLRDIFGYEVSHGRRNANEDDSKSSSSRNAQRQRKVATDPGYPHPRSPSPLLNRLFPSTTIYTYSYQESCLSRRLQRFCLEHTYRWLSDASSEPQLMSRVFGLFPCIQDMPGVRRTSRRVLQSEIGGPLEITKVPFYTLGGAGMHYPRSNEDGEPIYPVNRRRPGKILRRLAGILRRGGISDWDEDWSGDLEPDAGDKQGEDVRSLSEEERLRFLDLEGDWFDCHDVQGYLEDRGFVLEGSSVWLEVPAATVGALYGFSPDSGSDYCASQLYVSPGEISSSDVSELQDLGTSTSKYTLNVECFFDLLLSNIRLLGRAPGFRLWDVDAALRSAIHRRSF
ncbi:hypothetical protein PEBR_36075 [Penicillium brasilianum]|uniref:BZIP domain-containing protein n=1 Tax=Penicillium brasilianum TaxID=104259 RepID=A0A1S9RCH0_PENBI|nr:hypothetical protein PEBR_36075 [Penicillium brasilianum]